MQRVPELFSPPIETMSPSQGSHERILVVNVCIVQARYQQHQHPSAGRATALINHRLDSIPSHPGYSSLYIVEMPSSCLPNANATSNPNYRAVLQEILSSAAAPGWHGAAMVGHGAEDLELLLQVFAKIHNRGDVAAAVAVVGRGPDCDDVLVLEMVLQKLAPVPFRRV